MHIRDQVLHEVFFAECVQDIITFDDIIIKDTCRLEPGVDCLLRQLQTYRQIPDTICYEIKLIRTHNPSFSITKANIMNFYANCEQIEESLVYIGVQILYLLSVNSNLNPPQGRLEAVMVPPWKRTACFTMDSPSPVPPFCLDLPLSTR